MEGKTDKGLLFFYDWEECFDSLEPQEFKEMVMAMIRYKKYGCEPPQFTGVCKIIASLIFPQLDRQIKDFENGKKGGRPKKNINKEESPNYDKFENDELVRIALEKKARRESSMQRTTPPVAWSVSPKS